MAQFFKIAGSINIRGANARMLLKQMAHYGHGEMVIMVNWGKAVPHIIQAQNKLVPQQIG